MVRTTVHTVETAPEPARDMLEGLSEPHGGGALNIFGAMAESPAALAAYTAMEQALAEHSTLGPEQREAVHLRVSVVNECEYCTELYTRAVRDAGWDEAQTAQIAAGTVDFDAQLAGLLRYAVEVVEHEGHVDDATWQEAKDTGWNDQQLLDAYAEVVRTVFTNWFNHLVDTPIDQALTT